MNIFVSTAPQFFSIIIPKNASQRILGAIGQRTGKKLVELNSTAVPSDFIYENSDLPSFACIRNPLTRLYSCYMDKIVAARTNGQQFILGRWFTLETNWGDFVKTVAEIPDTEADDHFKSQASFVFYRDRFIANRWVRFEKFDDDWKNIASELELVQELEFVPVWSKRRKDDHKFHTHVYTPELIESVSNRYKSDIDLWQQLNNDQN